jgi:hypothetical protein
MLFMLRISAEMMVLAVMLPQLWAGLIGLVIAAYLGRQRRKQRVEVEDSRGLIGWAAMLSVVVIPLVMLAWGLYFWPDDPAARGLHERLALRGLDVLAVAQLAACLWLVWRRGGRPTAVVTAALAMWWAAAAWGTAGMAVTNTWL